MNLVFPEFSSLVLGFGLYYKLEHNSITSVVYAVTADTLMFLLVYFNIEHQQYGWKKKQ